MGAVSARMSVNTLGSPEAPQNTSPGKWQRSPCPGPAEYERREAVRGVEKRTTLPVDPGRNRDPGRRAAPGPAGQSGLPIELSENRNAARRSWPAIAATAPCQ